MTMQDILTLAKAGYTAAQISAMASAEQKPQEQKQPEQKQPEQKQPEQKQPEQPDIIAELREIKSAILAGAYMGAQQPATQDAESALAAIINPPDVLELLGKK